MPPILFRVGSVLPSGSCVLDSTICPVAYDCPGHTRGHSSWKLVCCTSAWRTVKLVFIMTAVQKRLGRGWETTARIKEDIREPVLLWNCAWLQKEDSEPRLILLNRLKWMFLVFTHRAGSWSSNGGRGVKLTNLEDHANVGRSMGVCTTDLLLHVLFILRQALSSNQ